MSDSEGPFHVEDGDDLNPCRSVTLCTGDHTNNMFWREGAPGYPGQCILDQMDYEQLFLVLQKVPNAGEHLRRITNSPTLIRLANEVKLSITEHEDNQRAADLINHGRGTGAGTLPFYTVLRGNSDGTVR